ncbi:MULTISPECIES: hypothetical protein [Photobacterium]|uniref:hypothetical protein n=1 Tax=Photobacterium TaxID=657 RepID=UPI000AF8E4DC|nr:MULTISPECIES: hypothetical protein [Photobacterium]MBV1842283.1 hypothetical protein [Photobacterium ganghwense]QSV16593.1 hypothetical protein FH974_16525 [Photobacterium ganghwense]
MLCPECNQPMVKTKDNQNQCVDINCPPTRTHCPKCDSANTDITSKSISDATLVCRDCDEQWTISRS